MTVTSEIVSRVYVADLLETINGLCFIGFE